MQRHACPANLFYQRFATRVDFIEVRRTKWLLSCSRENDVTHLQVADGPIVGCCQRIQFFSDAQRRLADFVIWTNVSDDGWINRVAKYHERVIAHLNRIGPTGKRARHHNEWIGRADQKTKFFQRANLVAQFRDCIAQLAFALGRGTCQRVVIFGAF